MFNVFSKTIKSNYKFKDLSIEEQKKFNSYMFCKWLSGNRKTLQIADFFNYYYQFIPNDVQFDIISDFTKQNKIDFIKFPSTKKSKYDVAYLQKKYNINAERAYEYFLMLENLGADL